MNDIRRIEARKVDAQRTGGLALGGTVVLLSILAVVAAVALFAAMPSG